MKVVTVLADTGTQDPTGKINLLGAGWSLTQLGPNGLTPDSAVAVFIEVPWDRANREVEVVVELVDEDGQLVHLPTEPPQPLHIAQRPVVPAPPGAPNGSPGHFGMLMNFQGGLPLLPGRWYTWRTAVDGESNDNWNARFFVRRQPSAPTFGRPAP